MRSVWPSHHYRDFDRLDLLTNEWAKVEPKGRGPNARSGHRMAGVDGKIFLFGGALSVRDANLGLQLSLCLAS
eukprot:SAG22_NODE_2835_length_2168_cov_1.266312_2_plen_73_part_00